MKTALGVILVLVGLSCLPTNARADYTQGTSCTAPAAAGIGNNAVTDGNNLVCVSGTWQYPTYVMQSAAAAAGSSCSTYPAGAMRYNTTLSNVEMCNGTNWEFLAASTSACGTPSGLSFTNVTNATLSTMYTSSAATITFSGCTSGGLSVSVTGAATAQISINGGAWTTSGSISSGQTIKVRLTSSGSVSTGLTATVTVGSSSTNWTVTTRSGSLQMFATSSTYIGATIGGLSAADTLCQNAANTASYSGTWKAVMSDASTSAASRLTLSYPIVNAYDGSTIASSNLWSGSLAGPIKTPSGGSANVWTGSSAGGAIAYNCTSWTAYSGGYQGGTVGGSNYTNTSWSVNGSCCYGGSDYCASAYALYCIQQ